MIIQFKNQYLEKLFQNKLLPGKPKYSSEVVLRFKKTILKLYAAENTKEVRSLKSLHFEALKGNWKGFYSVRVDINYRLMLSVDKDEGIHVTEILNVHELNNHYQ